MLSVLPWSSFEICDHLFPHRLCRMNRISSSSSLHTPLLIEGERWLHQRSLHCLPILPGRKEEMKFHFEGPFDSTKEIRSWSSFSDQGPNCIWLLIFFVFWCFWLEFIFFLSFEGVWGDATERRRFLWGLNRRLDKEWKGTFALRLRSVAAFLSFIFIRLVFNRLIILLFYISRNHWFKLTDCGLYII